MKPKEFRKPGALFVQYRRPREGPPSFLVWMPGTSTICMDRKALLKHVKWPVKTQTGDELRAWLNELEAEKPAPVADLDLARIQKEGFGPEAHGLDESDPNHKTRTVI